MRPRGGSAAAAFAVAGMLVVAVAIEQGESSQARADWRVVFDGGGFARVRDDRIELAPATAVRPDETHSALVVSRQSFADLELRAEVTTLEQLRPTEPNPWEVGWVLWSYLDNTHFYYLALKPNGWELGKEDPAYPGNQRFLATGESPAFPIGRTIDVRINRRGDTVEAFADGRPLVRVRDTERPYPRGAVGLYAEDAHALFEVRRLRR